jgi:Ca-activated chloride channel family protein
MSDASLVHFLEPSWLWWTPASLALLILMIWRWPHRLAPWHSLLQSLTRQMYRHPYTHRLQQLVLPGARRAQTSQRLQPALCYGVFIILMHVALAQPYRIGQQIPEPPPQRDIVFLVDTSVSMLLRDYRIQQQRTDRMTMLKNVLSHFIKNLAGNRISIIAFSEQAYTFVPLTADYALLQVQLRRLEPAVLTGRMSNISRALLYTLQQYDTLTSANEKPVFVLITDIHRPDRDIDPRAAAQLLANKGYRLHAIAIGAASYAAEEKDARSLVYHPANLLLLQQIAEAGHGQSFWAKRTEDLNEALLRIQQAELRKIESLPEFIHLPLYLWPLLLGVAWITVWQVVPLLRRGV